VPQLRLQRAQGRHSNPTPMQSGGAEAQAVVLDALLAAVGAGLLGGVALGVAPAAAQCAGDASEITAKLGSGA